MARLTVEDCLVKVNNNYDLIALATKRTRQLIAGKDALLPDDGDKPIVIALREIAKGFVTLENIEELGKHHVFSAIETAGAEEEQEKEL